MQDYLQITGGKTIGGAVSVSGAKNAALPLLISSILNCNKSTLTNVPDLEDIDVLVQLLKSFGAEVERDKSTGEVAIEFKQITSTVAPYSLVKLLRASFWVLGPLLARAGHAEVALPGGDAIGVRPVDIHLKGLEQMGASISLEHGILRAEAKSGLKPANVKMAFPSVGATHHLMMTAALVEGESLLEGAAQEPEVVELAEFLSKMGAKISGAGSSTIRINGTAHLGRAKQRVLGDRVEAASLLIAAAGTGGEVLVKDIQPNSLTSTLDVLREAGCKIACGSESIQLESPKNLMSFSLETAPFPGVATDMQPLLMALATKAKGESKIVETVFESRFGHIAEYRRFGADITTEGNTAIIKGGNELSGSPVHAGDIRAAAGLVLMGLISSGNTSVFDIHHLDRGYEKFEEKLCLLGAEISRVPGYEERELVIGC